MQRLRTAQHFSESQRRKTLREQDNFFIDAATRRILYIKVASTFM